MEYKLTKRWRIDSIHLFDLGVEVGIYVRKSDGMFYARVPETNEGDLYTNADKRTLTETVTNALQAYHTLDWREVIQVSYHGVYRWTGNARGTRSGRGDRWDPSDPESASDQVGPLILNRVHRAVGPEGAKQRVLFQDWEGKRTWSTDLEYDREKYLPYAEETWEALHDFQARIRELDHSIRTLLALDDLPAVLLKMSRQPLLLLDGLEKEE